MGALAQQAEQYYQIHLPQTYQQISNRAAFFQGLEDRAQEMIQQLTDQLAGPDQPGETYQDKLGRITAAQHAATEQVMREFLLSPPPTALPETGYPPREEPETAEDRQLAEAMTEFNDAATELEEQRRSAARATMPVLPPRPPME